MSLKLTQPTNRDTGSFPGKSIARRAFALFCAILVFGKVSGQINAQSDLYPVLQNSCNFYLDVAANDNVNASSSIQLSIDSQPANGTAFLNGSYISYCPFGGYLGVDQFTYSIVDSIDSMNTQTAIVYLNVLSANNRVYPGDADQNGTVEHFDVLAVGLAYGTLGPSRDTLLNNALAWMPLSFINTDPGATDCNGDGITDHADIPVIDSNLLDTFTVTHPYNVDTSVCDANGIPLYIVSLSGDSIMDGDSLEISIMLGESSLPSEAYGIAFTLEFDNRVIGGSQVQYYTDNSWLAQNDSLLSFKRDYQQQEEIQIALSKTNHNPALGGGEIMRAILPIDDNIDGAAINPGWNDLKLHLARVRLISEYNILRDVCIEQPAVKVFKLTTAAKQPATNSIKIYPNPSTGKFVIEAEKLLEVVVTDLAGKEVFRSKNLSGKKTQVDMSGVAAGSYLATVKTRDSVLVQKLFIQQ